MQLLISKEFLGFGKIIYLLRVQINKFVFHKGKKNVL